MYCTLLHRVHQDLTVIHSNDDTLKKAKFTWGRAPRYGRLEPMPSTLTLKRERASIPATPHRGWLDANAINSIKGALVLMTRVTANWTPTPTRGSVCHRDAMLRPVGRQCHSSDEGVLVPGRATIIFLFF